MTETTWIVVNIGCIECGVSSAIVGVFADEDRAKKLAKRLDETHCWREGGQNLFEVFPMPKMNEVAPEYADTIDASANAATQQIEGRMGDENCH